MYLDYTKSYYNSIIIIFKKLPTFKMDTGSKKIFFQKTYRNGQKEQENYSTSLVVRETKTTMRDHFPYPLGPL